MEMLRDGQPPTPAWHDFTCDPKPVAAAHANRTAGAYASHH